MYPETRLHFFFDTPKTKGGLLWKTLSIWITRPSRKLWRSPPAPPEIRHSRCRTCRTTSMFMLNWPNHMLHCNCFGTNTLRNVGTTVIVSTWRRSSDVITTSFPEFTKPPSDWNTNQLCRSKWIGLEPKLLRNWENGRSVANRQVNDRSNLRSPSAFFELHNSSIVTHYN